jgi:hypothetical protein
MPVALLALAPVLAACGQGDDAEAKDDTAPSSGMSVDRTSDAASDATSDPASSPASSSATATTTPAGADLPAACEVVKKLDIATAYGATPQQAQPSQGASGTGSSDGQGYSWTTDECTFTAKSFFTATVALAGPADFDGDFGCPEQSAATVSKAKVKGADQATWAVESPDPLDATLRVCSDQVVLDITLEFEPAYQHEGDPQAQSVGLAETVLERL